jgi:co-chaperonin GroES (HSP10)
MKPSRYRTQFDRLATLDPKPYELTADYLLVERIPDEELKTKSGLILASVQTNALNTLTADKPQWARVLACGEGYYSLEEDAEGNEVEKTTPLNAKPGDIVLVSKLSVKYFSLFGELDGYEPDSIGLTKESEIQLRFKGEEGYREAFASLNGIAPAPVEQGSSSNG